MPTWEFPGSPDIILIKRKNWIAVFASEFTAQTLSQRITILIIYVYGLSHSIRPRSTPFTYFVYTTISKKTRRRKKSNSLIIPAILIW